MPALIPAVLVLCITYGCCSRLPEELPAVVRSAQNITQSPCNVTGSNSTMCNLQSVKGSTFGEGLGVYLTDHRDVIYRGLIVFGSVSAIVIIYVLFRFIRRRRQMNKSRKYGLITMPGDTQEWKPLDDDEDDDDDEDMTVFDRTKPTQSPGIRLKRSQRNGSNGKHAR